MQVQTSYYHGYLLALESSKSLLKIADQSASLEEYGIACSLSILSAEEAIKACLCLHKHHYPETEFDKKIFSSHFIKHAQIKNHLILFDYLPTKFLRVLQEENLKEDSTFCSFLANLIKKQDDEFCKPGDLKAQEIRAWNDNANDRKNTGLYVGLQLSNGLWHDPRSITLQEFENEKRFSLKMVKIAEQFDEFHIKWKESMIKPSLK